ncbi:MAG: hypothetical protein OEV68_09425, partial [candidate division Zixibacteria bacterium]|nr:hypothetical protein [candidate division Zixibacteria bacterium]
IVRRSAGLSSLESTLGPSMAGSVEVSNLGDNLFDLLENAISDEAAEELSLSSDEYRLVPLAYGREVFRGERPQLFAALVTELSAREMTEKLDKLDAETREFDEFFFRPLTGILEGKDRVPPEINFEAAMNLLLLREYLSRHPQ